MNKPEIKRGRPQSTTVSTLRDAAFELFQSQGYENTSVTDIARVAGVSRATFFNYFEAKSDVFWVEVDKALELLPEELRTLEPHTSLFDAITSALKRVLQPWDGGNVPWIFIQFDLIGQPAAVRESATERISSAQNILDDFITSRLGLNHHNLSSRTTSYAVIAAIIAAAITWAQTPPPRGQLYDFVEQALTPLQHGMTQPIDSP
ncbi:MAG: TetR/AcrR family transcriptional regulator [Canibacter sp.]